MEWRRPEEWGEDIEWLFSVFHGELMVQLGFEEKPIDTAASMWMDWRERTAGRALDLLDHWDAAAWAVRRDETETVRLRARLMA